VSERKFDGRLILALLLILAGAFFRFMMRGYSFLAYALWMVALAVVFYRVMKLIKPKHPKAERILNKIMSYAIILFCMVFAITEGAIYYGSAPSEPVETDYVIVLGAGLLGSRPSKSLQYRLDVALDYLNEHPDAACIVSGCRGPKEDISEAEAMYNWLTERGIPGDRIIKEEQARNTKENISNSLELIENLDGESPDTVTIVTEGFHMLRATLIAKDMGVTPVSVPARTELPLLNISCYIREALALWKYLVLG
jgi:uncharacterized SAM-binding protein YcdF (DUF218 family)